MTALHSQPYKDVIERVIARRLELGWSQEELARRLPRYQKPASNGAASDEAPSEAGGQLQSFVSKFEQRQRRLDVIELMHVCHALGLRLCEVLGEHSWTGEPPPPVVPLARETLLEERPLALRRARAGRVVASSGWTPGPPAGGASRTSEAPIEPVPLAADEPHHQEADDRRKEADDSRNDRRGARKPGSRRT